MISKHITNILLSLLIFICGYVYFNLAALQEGTIRKILDIYEDNIIEIYKIEENTDLALAEDIPSSEKLMILTTVFNVEKDNFNKTTKIFNDFILIIISTSGAVLFSQLASNKKDQ